MKADFNSQYILDKIWLVDYNLSYRRHEKPARIVCRHFLCGIVDISWKCFITWVFNDLQFHNSWNYFNSIILSIIYLSRPNFRMRYGLINMWISPDAFVNSFQQWDETLKLHYSQFNANSCNSILARLSLILTTASSWLTARWWGWRASSLPPPRSPWRCSSWACTCSSTSQ